MSKINFHLTGGILFCKIFSRNNSDLMSILSKSLYQLLSLLSRFILNLLQKILNI